MAGIIGVHAPEALALGYLDFTPHVAIGQTKIIALSFASNLSSYRPENLAGYYMKWLGQVTKKDCQQRNGWKGVARPSRAGLPQSRLLSRRVRVVGRLASKHVGMRSLGRWSEPDLLVALYYQ